jgi:short-subunit dehydrogenase
LLHVDGRAVIITGASSGIGRETAREFARRRAHVVLAARDREKLEELAQELAQFPGRRLVVPTDVTDRLAVEALVRRTMEEFDSVDVLVNNAGVGLFAPIAGGSLDNMHHLFNVNFWGAIQCIQATVPYMRRQRRGHIVNVSSVAGKVAPPYLGIYSATKFALTAVSGALRSELAGTGVQVSTVYPGLTDTSFQERMLREVDVPDPPRYVPSAGAGAVARRIVQAVRWSLRDVYVTPQDFAAVTAYPLAPAFADWALRFFWLGSGTRPASPDRAPSFPEAAEAASGDPAEPSSETP